ncbi:MAG: NAD-dependent succinate-semialdehyde dehydrogenase [Candidatus Eisenbacteria bacterium]
MFRSLNPATGALIAEHVPHDAAEISSRLDAAVAAFGSWRHQSFERRAEPMTRLAAVLRRDRDALARLAVAEMGKPIAQAEAEVEKCAGCCEHFASQASRYLAPEPIATDASDSFVRFDPLGVVLAVMPWNFPFWQVIRAAVPALMAGDTVLLKHASNVMGCAAALERAFADAGFPPGAFAALRVDAATALGLVDDPRIAAVTLTGSEPAGRAIAARAGAALKRTVLELGGSDPFVVLADADVASVAEAATDARLQNNGQSCIAAKRFIIEAPIAEAFEAAFTERMARRRVGDPLDRATQLGPLARADLVDDLDRQVRESVAKGARVATGGRRLPGPGCYYAATVLTEVSPGMRCFDEETFGPLAAVTRARDATHAIELANTSGFGLGASLWTADAARGRELARDIETGYVFVNGVVRSDARLPFGGIKRSGWGRELSAFGIREFVDVKTVWVR